MAMAPAIVSDAGLAVVGLSPNQESLPEVALLPQSGLTP
jgi:hypothetical protein